MWNRIRRLGKSWMDVNKIHMVGFNGIVDFTWDEELTMMNDKYKDG